MRFAFHREAPGHLAGGMAMRCAGCVPLRLPCLAQPQPQRSLLGYDEMSPRQDRPKLQEQRPHLWRPSCLARCAGRRLLLRPASHRTAHAGERAREPGHGVVAAERHGERASCHHAESPRSPLRGRRTEPEMDRRLHLHLDRRRMALRCRRRRPVLPPCRRLGDEGRA